MVNTRCYLPRWKIQDVIYQDGKYKMENVSGSSLSPYSGMALIKFVDLIQQDSEIDLSVSTFKRKLRLI